jgi:excisionase family DNA binding protein
MNALAQERQFLTVDEVAEQLSVTRRTVYNWIRRGALIARRCGPRAWRISGEDFAVFVGSR